MKIIEAKYCIGIDPGKHTGYCVYDRSLKMIVSLETLDFVKTINKLREFQAESVYAVVIEVPMTKVNWHGAGAAHDVGRVCREAELMAAMAMDIGLSVIAQHPRGKVDQKRFKATTGYPGRTNQHVRDAGMLVFGL